MNFEHYDNDMNPSDADYFAFVNWLSEKTADELRTAKGDNQREEEALRRYYQRGEHANLTLAELIDFLCVSSPSILQEAGYSDEQAGAILLISDRLTAANGPSLGIPEVSP
jgi:hypothetical protein